MLRKTAKNPETLAVQLLFMYSEKSRDFGVHGEQ
jgi:hypothetical protein